jgi:hypothetical protein
MEKDRESNKSDAFWAHRRCTVRGEIQLESLPPFFNFFDFCLLPLLFASLLVSSDSRGSSGLAKLYLSFSVARKKHG